MLRGGVEADRVGYSLMGRVSVLMMSNDTSAGVRPRLIGAALSGRLIKINCFAVGWSFYLGMFTRRSCTSDELIKQCVGFERDMGLSFWDINFHNERIVRFGGKKTECGGIADHSLGVSSTDL